MLDAILGALLEDLREYGVLDLSECFIDGTFVSAKKGRFSGNDQIPKTLGDCVSNARSEN